jgi:N-acetyl-alpha-D-muramate 1-phosphate uridylyltransferase
MSQDRAHKAMILAAGRGERMRPLTDSLPKPLLRIAGKPLLQYHLEAVRAAGIRDVVINLAWQGEKISEYFGDGAHFGLSIEYSEEQPKALETAGGIFRALPRLRPAPFIVINGDIFCDFPLATLAIGAGDWAHLVLAPNPPQHPQGDFGCAAGRALQDAPQRFTFSGIAIYREEFFADCVDGAFPLKPLLVRAMQQGRCSAEVYAGVWEDVGTPERLATLDARITAAIKRL